MDKSRILLVDDEEDILTVLKTRLEKNDYEVSTAQDGLEALNKVRKEKPDLIILDIMLPKMDGFKVCSHLKLDSSFKDIPIIMFTAKTQSQDVMLSQQIGADAYIVKPFEPKVLFGKIQELLEAKKNRIKT